MRKFRELLAKLNGTYDYSSTQFNLPPQIANKIINWGKENIPDENLYHDEDGGKGREDEIHCTLLYGIHAEESPEILELVKEPIEVELGKIEKFDNDDYDVIKVTVLDKSRKLEELWNNIKDAEEYTSDYDKKFEPHVTIAYVKKGSCDDIIDSDPFAGDIVVLDNFKFSSTDKSKTKFKKLSIQKVSINYPEKELPNAIFDYIADLHLYGVQEGSEEAHYGDEEWVTDHDYFELKFIPFTNTFVRWTNTPPVYAKTKGEYPPIVVSSDGYIMDGMHRASSAKERGDEGIWAYIGVKNSQLNESMIKQSSYSDEDESQILEEVEDLIKKEFTDREIVRYLKEAFNLDSEDAYWFINAVQRSLNEPNELQQMVKDKEYNKTYLQTKAVSYGSTSYGSRIESLKEYPVYLHYLGEPDELDNHFPIGNWLLVIEGTPARYYLGQLLDYARGEKDKLVIDGGTNWTIHNMDKVVEEAYGLAKYLNPEMTKQSVKQMFTLQIGNATDMMRAIQALDELQNVRLNYTVSGDALLFGKQDDLNDAKTLLQKNGILALEKRAISQYDSDEDAVDNWLDMQQSGSGKILVEDHETGKLHELQARTEDEYNDLAGNTRINLPDGGVGFEVASTGWNDLYVSPEKMWQSRNRKTAISKDHIKEDLGRFEEIKTDAKDIQNNIEELKKDDNNLLKKSSFDLNDVYFRGCSMKEAIESCKAGNLVYYSNDPMSMDWEVIEYGLGDGAEDLNDAELGRYVKSLVPWKDIKKGVNLTNDISNAKGYGAVVLGVKIDGNFAEFSDAHFFAEHPNDCKVVMVIYDNNEFTSEEFLKKIMTKKNNAINIEKDIAYKIFNKFPVPAWKDILQSPNKNSMIDVYIHDAIEREHLSDEDYVDADIILDYLTEVLRKTFKLSKTMSIKKYNFLTGEDEVIEAEPAVVEIVESIGAEPAEEVTEECACDQIDPNQSKREIADQLMDTFIAKYPKAKTYSNIFACAKECGLVDAMDKYDIINIMNTVAVDVGLPRQGFEEFFPQEDITESADISGTSGAPEFNEGDIEGAIKEFMEGFDNVAESLYEIDRALEERYRMLYDGEELVESSKDIVRKALHNVKKDAIVKKYFMSDFKVKNLDRSGKCVEGSLIYKVQMTQAGKVNRTIVLELPIKANQVQSPKEFSYNNDTYPLQTWYLNDVFER